MTKIIEVHNAYAVHGLDEDGDVVDQPLCIYFRPQDWGHPRWHYERFDFAWIQEETHYINHAYCWTDVPMERSRYPAFFAPLIGQIFMPGSKPQECDRSHLRGDDFWDDDWGETPPYYDPFEEMKD